MASTTESVKVEALHRKVLSRSHSPTMYEAHRKPQIPIRFSSSEEEHPALNRRVEISKFSGSTMYGTLTGDLRIVKGLHNLDFRGLGKAQQKQGKVLPKRFGVSEA